MNIIGLVGFAGSGKDTCGNILCTKYGYKRYSMAKPLKDAISVLFGWDRDLLDGNTIESRSWREEPDLWWNNKLDWENRFGKKFTPRICMQYFGTDVIRNSLSVDFWILCLERYLETSNSNIVITDCRFINEMEIIKKLNGKVVEITRGNNPDWYYQIQNLRKNNQQVPEELIKSTDKHVSETEWIGYNFDYNIQNTTFIDLENQIFNLWSGLN